MTFRNPLSHHDKPTDVSSEKLRMEFVMGSEQWQDHQPIWAAAEFTVDQEVARCSCGEAVPADLAGTAWFSGHISELGAPDYMQAYWRTWAMHVEAPTGQLDRDAVARELADYRLVMEEASKVYNELSGLSKPNTAAHHVISFTEQRFAERYANLILCDLLEHVDTDGARQAVIDYAEQLAEGSYAEYLAAKERTAKYLAEATSSTSEQR